jgi:hypothetical protein
MYIYVYQVNGLPLQPLLRQLRLHHVLADPALHHSGERDRMDIYIYIYNDDNNIADPALHHSGEG